ncbi:hypothetical protein AYP76_08305 [Ligilactobacillus agilis]|uniref:Uncharacterized protein n=1 Tax=Ligilactobacillus agilis TaxID=1601 RepID=A0A231QL13_9LACO|nr:hypothetical protein [Ligilactobacillus agilis]OXC07184.1 hypothetical protein AYP76_08305 [Ligilactobacillus agilis]OXC10850.1 hypothetical protein AYP74_02860 [Ligilactobacillus agilis]OXC11158.1 hypothetical protein AYP75_04695 [Ligilactobacillus agilis]OXS37572.1 hypothetical protein AYP70_09490 [Ligilactobacillus agilis]OXS41827.1 hypothetical protein AYP69_01720 [Ligilactobacillus agilis]
MSDLQNKIKLTLGMLNDLKQDKPITEENLQVLKKQSSNGNKIKFDPDSSPEAWDYFKVFNDKIKNLNLKNKRLIWENEIINIDGKSETIDIAGDCSFNFNNNKMGSFEGIKLEDFQKRKLEVCQKMHHNLLNFDLMPVTGGMNNLKGNLKYGQENKILVHDLGRKPDNAHDRLDTFVTFIDYSLKKRNELKQNIPCIKEIGEFFSNSIFTTSLKGENFGVFYDFMDNYENVYTYCKEFYNIDSRSFIDRLVESGKKPIEDAKSLNDYMDLAIDYWILKGKTFLKKKQSACGHIPTNG